MPDKDKKQMKIFSSKYMNSLFVGNFKASFAGRGIEFQDFREYTPGDDAKYIDWARSSMESSMIMRRYKEEKSSDILCYIDCRESLEFQAPVKKILLNDIIDFLYHASISIGEKFGGYIDTSLQISFVSPQRNPSSIYKLQNCIGNFHAISDKLSINALMNPKLKRSIVFIISDSMKIDEKSFKMAGLKHDLIFIHISSSFEDNLDTTGVSMLRGIGGSISIDLSDKEKALKYIGLRKNKKGEFSKKLSKFGIDCMFLNEESSLVGEFSKLMKKRTNFAR